MAMTITRKFIVADNQDITRAGIHAYIRALIAAATVTDVADKRALTAALSDCGAAVVVIDYALFDINGIDDFLILRARFPKVMWMLFSNELSDSLIRRLCAVNNVSIVLKDNAGEEIRAALACATRGERYLCHEVTNLIAAGMTSRTDVSPLTPAETEVLKLIAKGASVKEMAAARNSSVHTIITHKKNIFRKLGVNNVYEATKYALRAGLVEMMEYYI